MMSWPRADDAGRVKMIPYRQRNVPLYVDRLSQESALLPPPMFACRSRETTCMKTEDSSLFDILFFN